MNELKTFEERKNELLKKGYLMKGDGTIVKYTK